jgi:hypothetical protein
VLKVLQAQLLVQQDLQDRKVRRDPLDQQVLLQLQEQLEQQVQLVLLVQLDQQVRHLP